MESIRVANLSYAAEKNGEIIQYVDLPQSRVAEFERKDLSAEHFVVCSCTKCNSKIEFEIYENGGVRYGKGASLKVRSSWIDGLTKSEITCLAQTLDLTIHEVDNNKYFLEQTHENIDFLIFLLLKSCANCGEDYILGFSVLEEVFKEKAIKFLISSISKINLTYEEKAIYILRD